MRIAVIGGGYVGLVSGACLASKGHEVLIVEQSQEKVAQINKGVSPIHEEGLDDILLASLGSSLSATTQLDDAVRVSDVTIIAVGTPFNGDEIDLTQIENASIAVGQALQNVDRYHVVVVKSTVVPGTTDDLVTPLLQVHSGKQLGAEFGVGMNPEFLREGNAVSDFMTPDRIVLGGNDDRARSVMAEVYAPFGNTDKVFVNNRTAEMIKYASNSLLATLISFSNEMGNLCSAVEDVDVLDVLSGVKLDKRLSPILENEQRIEPEINTYLAAGCGFGGSCFPKDVNALRAYGAQRNLPMPLLDAVMQTNASQPQQMLALLKKRQINLAQAKIAVLGLAFKPGTDDVRESPALTLIESLVDAGAQVSAYDPVATDEAQKALGDVALNYATSMTAAIDGAHVVMVVTSWPEFAMLPELLAPLTHQPLVIDGRRMLSPDSVMNYEGIGRGNQTPEAIVARNNDERDDDVSSAA